MSPLPLDEVYQVTNWKFRRSPSVRPPQIPNGSRIETACSVQGSCTGQTPQIAFAFISRRSLSSFLSNVEGGKKRYAWLPRHSASSCQSSE